MDRTDHKTSEWDRSVPGWRRIAAAVSRPFRRRRDLEHLMTFSAGELSDIGLKRWQIEQALRTGHVPD